MNIVIGRGKRRYVILLPCGSMVATSIKEDPQAYKQGLEMLCNLLGVKPRG